MGVVAARGKLRAMGVMAIMVMRAMMAMVETVTMMLATFVRMMMWMVVMVAAMEVLENGDDVLMAVAVGGAGGDLSEVGVHAA